MLLSTVSLLASTKFHSISLVYYNDFRFAVRLFAGRYVNAASEELQPTALPSCNPKAEGLRVLVIQTPSPVSAGASSRNAVLAKKDGPSPHSQ